MAVREFPPEENNHSLNVIYNSFPSNLLLTSTQVTVGTTTGMATLREAGSSNKSNPEEVSF